LVGAAAELLRLLEEVDELTDWAHQNKILLIAVVNPTSLRMLKAPGQWARAATGHQGADIVCRRRTAVGCAAVGGRTVLWIHAARMQYVRQMPGRIAGRTRRCGRAPGFSLTACRLASSILDAARATSNILHQSGSVGDRGDHLHVAAGRRGIAASGGRQRAADRRSGGVADQDRGVKAAFSAPRFHKRIDPGRPVAPVLAGLARRGILGGLDLTDRYPNWGAALAGVRD